MEWRDVERFIFEKMSETKIPGLSIAVSKGGEVIWSRAFGYRDLARLLPSTPETLYGIGSITKSFTCLSIMRLVEDGKLSLEDDVSEYVPLGIDGIEIWHLMSHTSGIPALGYAEALIRYSSGISDSWFPISESEHIIDFMSELKDWYTFEPGSRWLYLNEGYELLALVVERVSGKPFREFVRENVLEPIGLGCVYLDEMERKDDFAKPYVVKGSRAEESRLPLGAMDAAGGLACSVLDLVRYANFYLKKGNGIFDEGSILEMERPRIRVPLESEFDDWYGLGLRITKNFLGRELVGHGGSVLVYTAHFAYSRDEDIAVAVLSNTSGYPMSYIAQYALASAMGEDPLELPFIEMENLLKRYTGTYRNYRGTMTLKVKRLGDFLSLEWERSLSEPVILIPEDPKNGVFYTFEGSKKLRVEFFESKGKTFLLYERYLFSKEG